MPIRAISKGFRAVLRQWRTLLLIQVCSILLAGVPACIVSGNIAESVRNSSASESLRQGYDDLWYRHFQREATGLAATFDPALTGPGALFDGLDATLSGMLFGRQAGLTALGLLYLLLWVFFSGGLLRAIWDGDSLDWPGFFSHSARYFGRLLGLGILGLVGYWLILVLLHGQIRGLLDSYTRNLTDERQLFWITMAKYAGLWVLVGIWMVWLDSARILVVARDAGLARALAAGARLARSQPLRVGSLYGFLLLILTVYVLIYLVAASGSAQDSYPALFGLFLSSQTLFFLRLCLRLLRPASLMAAYRESGAIARESS